MFHSQRSVRFLAFCFLLVLSATSAARADNSAPAAPFLNWSDGTCDSIPYTGYAPRGFPKSVRFTLTVKQQTVEIPPQKPGNGSAKSEPANPSGNMTQEKTNQPTTKAVYYLVPKTPITRLYAGQQLIVDVTTDTFDKDIPLIAIGFQSAAATPINPAPVRSTQSFERTKGSPQNVCASTVVQADTTATVTVWGVVESDGSVVQLFSTPLPQVHVLDFFNISTGIVASTLRDNTFNRVIKTPSDPTKSPAVPATFTTTQGKTGQRVAPALFFTWYLFRKLDPEVPFQRSDLTPEPTIGFSLTNPGSDYFFGGSSEFFVRNVQLVYGFHYGKITELTPNQADDPFSSTAQATQQKFVGKAFIGATFNIDFIKRVFGK
jgi:hypothetical protein